LDLLLINEQLDLCCATFIFIFFGTNNSMFAIFGRTSHSPESGLGSRTSLPDSDRGDDLVAGAEAVDDDGDFADGPLTPLGTCKALYAFEGAFFSMCPFFTEISKFFLRVDLIVLSVHCKFAIHCFF